MGVVLKHNMVSGMGARCSRFNLSDVRVEATEILQQARDEAEQLKAQARETLRQAEEQAKSLLETTRKEGFQQGYTQGLEEGKKQGFEQAHTEAYEQNIKEFSEQSQQIREMLIALLTQFESEREQVMEQCQQDLLTLSMAVAMRVTRRQITVDPEAVLENVKAAIGLVASRSDILIKLNPADIEQFNLLDEGKTQQIFNLQHAKIIGDETIEAGGCVVQTPNGEIDAQIPTQLDNIVRQLTPNLKNTISRWSAESADTNETTGEEVKGQE